MSPPVDATGGAVGGVGGGAGGRVVVAATDGAVAAAVLAARLVESVLSVWFGRRVRPLGVSTAVMRTSLASGSWLTR
jgi:hypothetical protein